LNTVVTIARNGKWKIGKGNTKLDGHVNKKRGYVK
jgi:hypothetical protein